MDEYIHDFPEDVQERLEKIRQTVHRVAPEANETISYQIPTFKLDGRFLVYFAAFTDHISMYPIPPGYPAFNKKISPYIRGKGTLQFPLNEPLPVELVEEITRFHLLRRKRATPAKAGRKEK